VGCRESRTGIVKDDLAGSGLWCDKVIARSRFFWRRPVSPTAASRYEPRRTYLRRAQQQPIPERVQHAAVTFQAAASRPQAPQRLASSSGQKSLQCPRFGRHGPARANNNSTVHNRSDVRLSGWLVRETAAIAAAYGIQVGNSRASSHSTSSTATRTRRSASQRHPERRRGLTQCYRDRNNTQGTWAQPEPGGPCELCARMTRSV